jgi:hypothetical protein
VVLTIGVGVFLVRVITCVDVSLILDQEHAVGRSSSFFLKNPPGVFLTRYLCIGQRSLHCMVPTDFVMEFFFCYHEDACSFPCKTLHNLSISVTWVRDWRIHKKINGERGDFFRLYFYDELKEGSKIRLCMFDVCLPCRERDENNCCHLLSSLLSCVCCYISSGC